MYNPHPDYLFELTVHCCLYYYCHYCRYSNPTFTYYYYQVPERRQPFKKRKVLYNNQSYTKRKVKDKRQSYDTPFPPLPRAKKDQKWNRYKKESMHKNYKHSFDSDQVWSFMPKTSKIAKYTHRHILWRILSYRHPT